MNTPTASQLLWTTAMPADAEFPEVDYTADDLMVETGSDAMYNAYTAKPFKKAIYAPKLSAKDLFTMEQERRVMCYDNYDVRQK